MSNINCQVHCHVSYTKSGIVVKTSYDQGMVTAIKGLPYNDRRYNPQDKTWVVDPRHNKKIADWILLYFGEVVSAPTVTVQKPDTEMRMLECHYVGVCKDRDGQSEAFGCTPAGEWLYIFPEGILRSFFDGTSEDNSPKQSDTLYSVLGVPGGASSDELKTGYRRMVRQWHPDVCREPNAHEVFLRVQEAYEILSAPGKRARYDAGLALEATLVKEATVVDLLSMYRAPLRCGQISCEGVESIGRFRVSKILVWSEIYNSAGQVLVSSWPKGATEPLRIWA